MSLPFSPQPLPWSTSTMACLVLQNFFFFLTPQESCYLWPAPSALINTCSKQCAGDAQHPWVGEAEHIPKNSLGDQGQALFLPKNL